MEVQHCHSCGMPVSNPEELASRKYCLYCTDASGKLKTEQQILAGIAFWLQSWSPPAPEEVFRKRARAYMSAMPRWADQK